MEENVALDSNKQKQFVKSIKGIKKLLKISDKDGAAEKFPKTKGKSGKVQKQKRQPRGLVYLGHIPHGFYENEMTQYFKQFGVVTNVRVIRSKRTGRSKGHAFVEFKDPDVAEVVAETMNNYLMGKRLIKAASIPPEKQRRFAQRKHWNAIHNPTNEMRIKMRKAYNINKDEDGAIKQAKKLLLNFRKSKKKLNDLGINYDIFSPVDVPEVLSELLAKPEVKQEKLETKIKKKDQSKKNIKEEQKQQTKVNKKDEKINKKDEKINKKDEKINKREEKINKKEDKINKKEENINKKEENINKKEEKINKKDKKISQEKGPVKAAKVKSSEKESKIKAAVKNEQKLKEKKLKVAGVKSVENFIKINTRNSDDADSDSDYEFDSDEFEKMLENEADNNSESESAGENAEDEESEENDSEESEVPVPQMKMTRTTKNKAPQQVVKQQSPQKIKRKAIEKPVSISKKSKFENRNTQKLNKKQFKKRK